MTSITQYGYKSGLSTLDATIKIEHAIQTVPGNTTIVLMDLSKAFGRVNRQTLWAALYKAGLPLIMIDHIRQGHQHTTIRYKDNGTYGPPTTNNVGVSQRSALSALLFIIYLDDVMQDFQAISDQQLPQRTRMQPKLDTHTNNLIAYVNSLIQNAHDETNNETLTHNDQHEQKEREDSVIYADGANSINEHDTPQQIATKLQNYDMITITRQVGINWGKVHIITRNRNRRKIKPHLRSPFNQLKIATSGKVLGKKLDISFKGRGAVTERIKKARSVWNALRGNCSTAPKSRTKQKQRYETH